MSELLASLDPDALRVLEERARALARPAEAEAEEAALELVVLVLGEERYGVEVDHVVEVQPVTAIAPIPGTPPIWAGLISLRGTLRPVLDLRRYLGLATREGEESEKGGSVAIVSAAGLTVGLLADAISETRAVPLGELGPPLGRRGEEGGLIQALTRDLIAILDVEALLADPAIAVEHEPG